MSGKIDMKLPIAGISVSGRNRAEQLRATAMSTNTAQSVGEVFACDVCGKTFGRSRELVVRFLAQFTLLSFTDEKLHLFYFVNEILFLYRIIEVYTRMAAPQIQLHENKEA